MKNVSGLLKMDMRGINNGHILRFREKVVPYNLDVCHVSGKTHAFAYGLSHIPKVHNTCVDEGSSPRTTL